jgi:hypothetical protein
VHIKSFYSQLLDRKVTLHVTSYAIRWMEKCGGLDAFIMFTPPRKLTDSDVTEDLRLEMEYTYEKATGKAWDRRAVLHDQILRGDRRRGRWRYDLTPLQLAYADRLPPPINAQSLDLPADLQAAANPTPVSEE